MIYSSQNLIFFASVFSRSRALAQNCEMFRRARRDPFKRRLSLQDHERRLTSIDFSHILAFCKKVNLVRTFERGKILSVIAITLGWALFGGAHATEAQASNVAPPLQSSVNAPSQCELHIWPAERLEGVAFWLYNGLLQGRASTEQIEGAMGDLVGPSTQVAALREANVVDELGLPADTRVVEHQEPLDPKTLNKNKSRRAQSASRCYFELIMMRHVLLEDIIWGDRFLSTFMFRTFGNNIQAENTLKGHGGNKLKVLTQTASARPANALQLAALALRANFLEFTKSAHLRTRSTRRVN